MEYNAVAEIIKKYVLDSVNIDSIDNDMDIFEEGLVSSLFAIELMTFLEKNFEIKITTSDLDMDNYRCINNITEFVCEKKGDDNR